MSIEYQIGFVLKVGHFSTSNWIWLHLGALHPPAVPQQITHFLQGVQILVSQQRSHYFKPLLGLAGKETDMLNPAPKDPSRVTSSPSPTPEGPSRATSYSAFVDSDLGLTSHGNYLISQV